jgi:hypothetical protein
MKEEGLFVCTYADRSTIVANGLNKGRHFKGYQD